MDTIDSKRDSTVHRIYRHYFEKVDKTSNYETPVWLNDIIVVTGGTKMNTERNCSEY